MLKDYFYELIEQVESGKNVCVDTQDFTETQLRTYRNAQVAGYANRKDIVALKFYVSTEAYYSGATYDEEVIILADDFIKYVYESVDIVDSDELEGIEEATEVYVGELDGKHSEVYGDLCVEILDQEDLESSDFSRYLNSEWDGTHLLNYVFNSSTETIKICKNNLKEYTKDIDRTIHFTVTIKESQKEKLEKFIEQLRKEEYNKK